MSTAETSITIYSGKHQGHLNQNELQNIHNIPGYAVIKQSKLAQFKRGQFSLAFDDVAEHIDPTTVSFTTPDNPDAATVLDQNFQFDLVGSDKLLQKYLDQVIHVNHNQGESSIETSGKLLSTEGGLTLQSSDNTVITISSWNHIKFPELPGGLLTKPTLVWLLDSQSDREETINLSYQTQGMTWWTDYIITLNEREDQCVMDFSSWVSLVNKSGVSFTQSQLKLIAGDVNRSQPRANNQVYATRDTLSKSASNQFTEQALFEYHMYKLPRAIDLPNNSTKQIQLIPTRTGLNCHKRLIFNGSQQSQIGYRRPITDHNYLTQSSAKIEARLQVKNTQNNQLGMPLPAGRVRVNTQDADDGSIEFIGEDSIEHTTKNETLSLLLGHAFDVKGKRKQSHFELTQTGATEQFEITINNQKSSSQEVEVIEPLYRWSNWQITQHNEQYRKLNSSTIKFTIQVPAESSKTISYTVQYQWPMNKK